MKKKLIYLLAAVTLTAAVWGAGPMQSRAVDLSRKGSMTVHSLKETEDNAAMAEDVKTADVVVDVYQVAEAVKTDGYDSYTYAFLPYLPKLMSLSSEVARGITTVEGL